MSPIQHTVISGVVSAGFAYCSHSFAGAIACFLGGIFIDIDHFIDFWINKKKMWSSYKELHSYFALEKQGRLYLCFHAYELHAFLWFVIIYYQLSVVWVGLVLGANIHLIFDQVFNPIRSLGYFAIYRFKVNFAKLYIFTPEYYETLQ